VLRLAGVQDAWVFARGQTRTTTNYAKATFAALEALSAVKMTADQRGRVQLVSGPQTIKTEDARGEAPGADVVVEGGA
jgi:small subunit ribosomal protein S5